MKWSDNPVIDRGILVVMMLLLSADTFFASFVGPQGANIAIVAPLAALAYLAAVVRPALSSRHRRLWSMHLEQFTKQRAHVTVFALFLISAGFAFVRATQFGSLDLVGATYQVVKWGSVVTIILSYGAQPRKEAAANDLLTTVAVGFAVYIAVNLGLLAIGYQNSTLNAQYISDGGVGSMLALLGLSVPRLPLPISGGLNTSGLQVAAAVVIGLALLRTDRSRFGRGLGLLLVIGGTVALLITDSRGGMLGVVGGALFVFSPIWIRQQTRWLTVAIPLLPLLLLLVASLVQNEPWAQELQRGGADGVGGALTGRPLIWGTIALHFASFQPTHILGYGAFGQLGSGVSEIYSAVFQSSYATAVGAGAHNTLFQALLDVGYVGTLLQLLLFWHLLSAFGRSRVADPMALVGLGSTIAIIFIGLTGETLSIVTPNTLVLFLALNVYCLSTPERHSLDSPPTPDDVTRTA